MIPTTRLLEHYSYTDGSQSWHEAWVYCIPLCNEGHVEVAGLRSFFCWEPLLPWGHSRDLAGEEQRRSPPISRHDGMAMSMIYQRARKCSKKPQRRKIVDCDYRLKMRRHPTPKDCWSPLSYQSQSIHNRTPTDHQYWHCLNHRMEKKNAKPGDERCSSWWTLK